MLKVANLVSAAVLAMSFAGAAYAQQGMGQMHGDSMGQMHGDGMGQMHGDGMGKMMNAEHREKMQQHKMLMTDLIAAQTRKKDQLRERDCAARFGNPNAGSNQRGTCS